MNQILVSEDALNSIKSMAQRLQDENDQMRQLLVRTSIALEEEDFPHLLEAIKKAIK